MKTFTDQIGVRFYCIRHKDGSYWSNEFGWVDTKHAEDDCQVTVFTEQEKQEFALSDGSPLAHEPNAFWEIF